MFCPRHELYFVVRIVARALCSANSGRGTPKICSLLARNVPSQILFEILEGRFAASDL